MAIIGGEGVTTLGIDTGDTEAQLNAFADGVGTAADVLRLLAGASSRCNAEGDLLSYTFKQILEDGSVLTTTLRRVIDAQKNLTNDFTITAQSITRAKQAIIDFNAIQVRLDNQKVKDYNSQFVDTQKNTAFTNIKSTFNTKNATPAEINALNQAIVAVVSNLDKEGTSLLKLENLFARLKAGADDFAVSEQKVVNQLLAVIAAGDKLGSAQGRLNEKTKARTSKDLNTVEVVTARRGANDLYAGALASANPAQLLAYNKALNAALVLVQRGDVSAKQFAQTLNNIRAGKIETNLTPALAQLQQRLVGVQGAFTSLSSVGSKAFSNLGITASGVIRIFESQVIYSAIGTIRQAFGQATKDAAAFSKQIGLVQTISQDANVSTSEWTDGLRALSDKLGRPIADTAAAAYQALSNQVAKGADAFKFLTTAGEFARTTNSSLADSVDLISAALNSYGLSSGEAESVSRSLFTTIDKGRVTASELANSVGRIYTQGANLNISYQEVNAVLSTLTIQGIKANQAFTLFGNVIQKLSKPTEELQKVLTSLGYATSEDAIAGSGGVIQFLIKLRELSDEGRVAYNALFDEIRGRRGFENLTADGGKAVLENLAAQKSNATEYESAKGIVSQTLGQKFEDQINKIHNFFVVDVGGTFLKNVIALSDEFGGLANRLIEIVNIIKQALTVAAIFYATTRAIAFVQALDQIVLGFGLIRTQILAAAGAANVLAAAELTAGAAASVATAGLSTVAGLAAAYFLLSNDFYNQAAIDLRALTAKYQEEADRIIDIEQKSSDKRAKIFNEGLDNVKSALSRYSAGIRAALTKGNEALQESGSGIADKLKAQLDLISGTARSSIQELENRLKTLESRRKDNVNRIKEGPQDFADKVTQRNLAINDFNVEHGGRDQGLQIQYDAINRLKKQAASLKFDVSNPEQLEKILDKIDSITSDIYQRSIKSGNINNIASADRLLLNNDQQRYRLLVKQTEELNRQEALTRQQAADQKSLFEQFQEAEKHVVNFSAFDNTGQLKEKYRGEGGSEKAANDLVAEQQKVIDIVGKLGAGIDTKIHTQSEYAKQVADLGKILNQQSGNVGAQVKASDDLRVQAIDAERLVTALEKIKQLKTEQAAQGVQAVKDQQEGLKAARIAAATLSGKLEQGQFNRPYLNQVPVGDSDTFLSDNKANIISDKIAEYQKLSKELSQKLESGTVGVSKKELDDTIKLADKLVNLGQKIEGLKDKSNDESLNSQSFTNSIVGESKGLAPPPTIGSTAKDALDNLIKVQQASKDGILSEQGTRNSEQLIKDLTADLKGLDPAFKEAVDAAALAGPGISDGLRPAEEAFKKILDQAHDVRAALDSLATPKSVPTPAPGFVDPNAGVGVPGPGVSNDGTSSDVQTASRGGMVGYYASGGFVSDFLSGKYAKGTDTQPAMLTKGEYVIDAGNTKKFLPLLRSITDGSFKPSPRGVTTSTNVGDIHINVQGGNNSQQTIREIGSGLRRGIRQGVIRLQ